MSVLDFREVLPRTFRHRFGDPPQAERKFTVSLTQPVPNQQILNTVGIFFGALHPEYPYLRCVEGNVTETDRHYAEVTYRYELPPRGAQQFEANPLARADVWTFSTGGAQVPALTYYDGSGNTDIKPLVNTANEFVFESLTTLEAEVRATISSNRAVFPLPIAADVTNAINASPYLFGARHTWLCAGINASQAVEAVNNVEITYWQITVELVYRASGWNLLLPNVGLDQIKDGEKIQCTVKDKDGEEVPASTPKALNTDGSQKTDPNDPPDILDAPFGRRIYREIDFAPFFGTPPF
jgi:hypothetical protein